MNLINLSRTQKIDRELTFRIPLPNIKLPLTSMPVFARRHRDFIIFRVRLSHHWFVSRVFLPKFHLSFYLLLVVHHFVFIFAAPVFLLSFRKIQRSSIKQNDLFICLFFLNWIDSVKLLYDSCKIIMFQTSPNLLGSVWNTTGLLFSRL